MNYQKISYQSKTIEGFGYGITVSAAGAIVYGLIERDINLAIIGVGSILSGASIAIMGNRIHKTTMDVGVFSSISNTSLETKLQSPEEHQ